MFISEQYIEYLDEGIKDHFKKHWKKYAAGAATVASGALLVNKVNKDHDRSVDAARNLNDMAKSTVDTAKRLKKNQEEIDKVNKQIEKVQASRDGKKSNMEDLHRAIDKLNLNKK